MFDLVSTDMKTGARAGALSTPWGVVPTPVFMPVGTNGTVKMLTPGQVREAGAAIVLANTYHLMIRPGISVVETLGGLHRFSSWDGALLTDSGGFQVFSLADLRTVTDEGVLFRSPVDGSEMFLSPAGVIDAQKRLGSDIAMVLDECSPADAPYEAVARAADRTVRWARASRDLPLGPGQRMFGIVQGGRFEDLRVRSARAIVELGFPGHAVGGVSVGEDRAARCRVLECTAGELPADRPRYVMGIGEPADILDAVGFGYDMFDCVLPTRNGRNGSAFTFGGPVNIRNSRYRADPEPLERGCSCYCCRNFTRGYLRHLFNTKEALGPSLLSWHNITFFMRFTRLVRESICSGTFTEFRETFMNQYYQGDRE